MCTVDKDVRCAVEAENGKLPMETSGAVVRGRMDAMLGGLALSLVLQKQDERYVCDPLLQDSRMSLRKVTFVESDDSILW
ncbi:uncharacterized protein N7483_002588 [Penicillium malachiteum]|uniref:uncharacterized protein n=1 Tax=Penicillium malachiteum TaxID=1324776 RepID=UPI002547322F|nr:uncharacterized protein N7483_002588 [Penicillium malachiteum]KAJ5737463.1 hypothetical protein N7483_002588 [Penicillium malachiteum]